MDVVFDDEFASRGVVPCVDASETDMFSVSLMCCTRSPTLERSPSQSFTSSEPSTTSSSDVPVTSVGIAGSAESTASYEGMLWIHSGRDEDAAVASLSGMLKKNCDGGLLGDPNGSLPPTSVEGGVILKPGRRDHVHNVMDSYNSCTGQIVQENHSMAPDNFSRWCSIPDEASFNQLDDLLQLDSRESLANSDRAVVDNYLHPPTDQSFSSTELVGDWAAELCPDFSCLEKMSQPIAETYEEPVENVSQVFDRWLQNNSHRFTLSDISKIKLKTSTVENGMKRLGGGKKGLLYFLKIVLSWIQTQHVDRRYSEITGLVGKIANIPGKEWARIPVEVEDLAAVLEAGRDGPVDEDLYDSSIRRKDELFNGPADCDLSESAATQHKNEGIYAVDSVGSAYKNCYPCSTASFQNNWNSMLSRNDENCVGANPLFYASNSTPHSVAQSSLPFVANVGHMGSQWHDNAVAGSPLQEQAYLQPRVILSKSVQYSSTYNSPDLTVPNTSAATTRAARMSRMERRKWSVQRNRKWSLQTCHGPLRV